MKLYKPSLTIGSGRGINNGKAIAKRCNKAVVVMIVSPELAADLPIIEMMLRRKFFDMLRGTGLCTEDYEAKQVEFSSDSAIPWDNPDSLLARMIFRMRRATTTRLAGESKGGYLIPPECISPKLAAILRGEE